MAEQLDPLNFPLHGARLIEASAGTGKTWTIAALYVRLVLGHGNDSTAFARPLVPAEILVMTFTRAATRELSDRIRARLIEAAQAFRSGLDGHPDEFLRALADHYPPGAAREAASWRLATAADAMDDAAVQTIDAWSQRMLREHAFDSGNLFDEELEPNEQAMLREASLDYWRRHIYPLQGESLEDALDVWVSADALLLDIGVLIAKGLAVEGNQRSLVSAMDEAQHERLTHLGQLKAEWAGHVATMRQWIDQHYALFDKKKLTQTNYRKWLDALGAWTADASVATPALTPVALMRLTPAGLREALREGELPSLPDAFDAYEALPVALHALPSIAEAVRRHATGWISARLAEKKARLGRFSYSDLQERLARALDEPGADSLRRRIVEQFPVALVDEFQDTSPRQYRIFECLYRPDVGAATTGLFLIGDPKQSIYAFRGADIHSYLRARQATTGRHYALAKNYRSTQAVVDAVNHLFLQAEPRESGAFLFRRQEQDPLPFAPVNAHGRSERLLTAGGPLAALTVAYDDEGRLAEEARRNLAAHCAERIAQLLSDAQARIERSDGTSVRLRSGDIAVLVRNRTEAGAVREALRERGVTSIYLSEKDSVFASQEAQDLALWLRALANLDDQRLARAVYATSLASRTLNELVEMADDEVAWDERLEELKALRAVWQRQGVLPFVRQLLHRLDLPARLLALPAGERRLTNVLHLAELLQTASTQHDGPVALVRWLIEQVVERVGDDDERVVRLESDEDMLKIVTVFGSKGLEYAVVFVPFVADYRLVGSKEKVISRVDPFGARSLVMQPTKADIAAADLERLREDVRLLYVALTRARHAIWVGASAPGQKKTLQDSAFGRLIGVQADAPLSASLAAACSGCADIALEPISTPAEVTVFDPAAAPRPLAEALAYNGQFDRQWTVGSYSAIVRDASARPGPTPLPVALPEVMRNDEPAAPPAKVGAESAASWHRFPRGAVPGNFLHEQLEWLSTQRFDLTAGQQQERLRRRCEQQGWGHRQEDTVEWLTAVVRTPLPPLQAPLAALSLVRAELEFWLPVEQLEAAEVDAICRRHLLIGQERPYLPERSLHGMLMGFADLVFEHQGRYWVLDYKSNALGQKDESYDAEALAGEIASHRYDVQGALYLLALHRLLKARLAGYSPAEHLGGAIFFFLRGIQNATAGCHTLPADSALLDELDQALSTRETA